jgi:hypothetical protein
LFTGAARRHAKLCLVAAAVVFVDREGEPACNKIINTTTTHHTQEYPFFEQRRYPPHFAYCNTSTNITHHITLLCYPIFLFSPSIQPYRHLSPAHFQFISSIPRAESAFQSRQTRESKEKIKMASSNSIYDAQASTNYKEAFALFDKRGTQRVSLESLGDLLRACGQNPTLAEIRELETNVGSDCQFFLLLSCL